MIETKQEKQDPRGLILAVVLLVVGLGVVGGLLYWLLAPQKQRQVVLSEADAKQADPNPVPNRGGPPLPAMPAMPTATDPGATLVSIDMKNVIPQAALTELAKQSKIPIQSTAGAEGFLASIMAQRISVTASNQPFWAVLRDICKQGNLMPVSQYDNRGQIQLQPTSASDSNLPVVQNGSSMLMLRKVTSTFDADVMSAREVSRQLEVEMTLFVEPKLAPFRISPSAVVETAVDEKGTSLIRPPQQWDDRGNGNNERTKWMRNVTCRLQFAKNAGDRIAKLKGYISVTLAGPTQTVTVKDPLKVKNLDQTIDTTTVRIMNVAKQGANSYQAFLAGDGRSPIFKEWEVFSKIANLKDAKGKTYNQGGGGWGGGNQNTMEFSIYFYSDPNIGEPTEMDITLPTAMKELRIPFDFTDLTLPH